MWHCDVELGGAVKTRHARNLMCLNLDFTRKFAGKKKLSLIIDLLIPRHLVLMETVFLFQVFTSLQQRGGSGDDVSECRHIALISCRRVTDIKYQ